MKSIFYAAACALALLLSRPPLAQAQLATVGAGGKGGASAPAFTGVGDVQSTGWIAWWGMRAFSVATRGTNLINVCNPGRIVCADFASDAVTGNLPTSFVVGGVTCDNVSNICTIKSFYDQTGNAITVTAPSEAQSAKLKLSCDGTKPCAHDAGGMTNNGYLGPTLANDAQPLSLSAVAAYTTNNGDSFNILRTTGLFFAIGTEATGIPIIYAGNVGSTGGSQIGVGIVAYNGTANSTSSSLNYNGTLATGLNAGTNGTGGDNANIMAFGTDIADFFEGGINSNGLSNTVLNNICTNQKYWSLASPSC